jgi:unsaturated rhamnogalacturonyl hydrolase
MKAISASERSLFTAIADAVLNHRFQCWFYGDSVGFEGLVAASDLLGERRYVDFAHGFFRAWAARIAPFQPDDNTAPGAVMCEVAARTGDEILRDAIRRLAEHLVARRSVKGVSVTFEDALRSLRPPYGGAALSAEEAELMRNPGAGVWLDCLHFDPPFYAHLSALGEDEHWARRAVDEALAYGDLLRDPETGLYQHFWLERTGRAYAKGWGRGQGWALLGLIDVVEHARPDTPGRDAVARRAQDLARRMLAWQQPDGGWSALVHEPRSGGESSTAAFMATAFYRGVAMGLLAPEEFREPADRAYGAMMANLDATGRLRGVSAAVYSALVETHYWHVPVDFTVPWGQGPALTAALARARLE